MKRLIPLLLAPALAGCSVTTQGVTSTADSTVAAFQNICLALPQAHADFLSIASAFNVKQSIMAGELKAYNAGVAFCSSGVVTVTASAVKTAAGFVDQINAAKAQAGGS